MKLLLIAGSFCAGIVLSAYLGWELEGPLVWAIWAIFFTAFCIGIITAWLLRFSSTIFLLLAVLMLGMIRAPDVEPEIWQNLPADGEVITVEGVLLEDARRANDGFQLNLTVDSLLEDGARGEVSFPILAYAERLTPTSDRASHSFIYGDRYLVSGRFREAPPDRDFAGSISTTFVDLVSAEEGNSFRRWLAGVRADLSDQIVDLLPADVGGLAAAVTVGDRKFLLREVTENFRLSGLSHIIAISGLHLSLLGGLVLALSLAIFGRRRGIYLILPLITVWAYVFLAGFGPPVTRAAIMFSVYLLARLTGRQGSAFAAISFTAVLMVAITPAIITSVSFQLSFTAVIGVVLFASNFNLTRITRREFNSNYQTLLWQLFTWTLTGLLVSLGAVLLTVPIVLSTFGTAPVLGPVATLLVVPALPLFIIPTLLAGVLGQIWDPLGVIVVWPSAVVGEYILIIGEAFSQFDFAALQANNFPIPLTIAWYVAVVALFFGNRMWRKFAEFTRTLDLAAKGHKRALPSLVGVAVLLTCSWFVLAGIGQSQTLRIHFPEISLGDLIFLEFPDGTQVLIDGGRTRDSVALALDDILPFWDRSIDLVILTHPDADHLGGLGAALDRYEVSHVLDSNTVHTSNLFAEWQRKLQAVAESGATQVTSAAAGMVLEVGNNATLEVLWAGRPTADAPVNDASTVIRLQYRDFSALFTGDITASVEDILLQSEQHLGATLLKVPHHGSRTSSSVQFLEAVQPSVAVVQVGVDNRFDHPHCDVLENLSETTLSGQVLVSGNASPEYLQGRECETQYNGSVTVFTNGERVWYQTTEGGDE